MTGPREWRHAESCPFRRWAAIYNPCTCGLSAVRDAVAAGHRAFIGPDGVEGRVELTGWHDGLAHVIPLEDP